MSETAEVAALPECSFCLDGTKAEYDFKTIYGPWAFGCESHYKENRAFDKLGTGMGQRLVADPSELQASRRLDF